MGMSKARVAAWNHASAFKFWRLNGSTYATCVRDLVELREATDAVLDSVVVAMHDAGYSFTEIGEALEVSRQSARDRYLRVTKHDR